MALIEVEKLSKAYLTLEKEAGVWGSVKALFAPRSKEIWAARDVTFSIEEGELVGFLGPNGAGKTTTLKMLSGILYPTTGSARVMGYVPWERQHDFQRRYALVMGQKNQLWWDLPARESFLLLKEIYEVDTADFHRRVDELATLLDVERLLDVQVRLLSLGERMKCELIAALLHAPRVLFLDEPTIGLDVISQQKIRQFIRAHNREQRTTILLTSHYMDDIQQLCERVIIIDQGRVIFDDRLQLLSERYSDHKTLRLTFESRVERADLEPFGLLREFTGASALIEVGRQECAALAATILTRFPVADVEITEVPVEEIIRRIFNEAASQAPGQI